MYLIVSSCCFMNMLNGKFLSKPLKMCKFCTVLSRINSWPTKRPTDLPTILHKYLKILLFWSIWISAQKRILLLETLQDKISLSFNSFSVVVVVRENWDLPLDGRYNTLPSEFFGYCEWIFSWLWLEIFKLGKIIIHRERKLQLIYNFDRSKLIWS